MMKYAASMENTSKYGEELFFFAHNSALLKNNQFKSVRWL